MKDREYSLEPWWWEDAAPTTDVAASLPAETDVLVIGSGYTGLCCALELARMGADVTVVDAGAIGAGASTRAAGFTSGRAGVSKQIDLTALVGADHARAILEEADEAYEHLQDFIAQEQIDCDFEQCGRFVGAHTRAAYAKLSKKMAEYNRDGKDQFAMIPEADQGAYIQSAFYCGGMLIRNAGVVDPAKYHQGLVRLCRAAGVRLVADTRVHSVLAERGRFRALTTRGEVAAGRVALGTNGYTDDVAPWQKRRIIPLSSTIIATEPLGTDCVERLLPAGCPVIDAKRVHNFARPTPDHRRILFGGRASFLEITEAQKCEILLRQLSKMFPELEGAGITHVWGGRMGFTFDFLPKIGMHEGVNYAVGCNGGSGIVMMSWLGRKMARQILGGANRDSAFEGLHFKSQPFYGGKPWFLPFIGTWYRFRDWLDLQADRIP